MSPLPAPPDTDLDLETEIREQLAPLWRVICHDDPITTMEFVIEVLRGVFRLTPQRALEVMYTVHYTGSALVGHYPEQAANKKVKRATALARARKFPLTFTIEQAE